MKERELSYLFDLGNNNEECYLEKNLKNDIRVIQNKIKHRNLYNVKNLMMRILIKCGIAFDFVLPMIVSASLVFGFLTARGNKPFKIDEIVDKARIETIDTSSGKHIETISYDFEEDDEVLEYSTGWIINDDGLYERTVTSYRLNNSIDLDDVDSIFSMTKEEIESELFVTNIQLIQKASLEPEDEIYNEDALIIINNYDSQDEYFTRTETVNENKLNSLLFILLSVFWSYSFKCIGDFMNIFVKIQIRDVLESYEPMYVKIDDEEIRRLEQLLRIKQENLSLLNENCEYDIHNVKIRRLIK